MRKLISVIAAVSVMPWMSLSLHAEDGEVNRRVEEAIKVISNPDAYSRAKHEAMVALQELRDVRSIDALYEQIDFVSNWGNNFQRTTTNSYPATHALILIGDPSIEGAERFVSSGRSLNTDQLWLTTYVVGTIFQISTGEEPGSKYPKAREMTLEWIKKNFTVPQMRKAAERHFPDLEEYLSTLPDDPVIDGSNIHPENGESESPSKLRSIDEEVNIGENTDGQSSSGVPAAQHIPETTTQITKPHTIWWLIGGGVLFAFLALLFRVWKTNSNE